MAAGELGGMLASLFADFDRERREIEAALHDGVQQDLAAAAVSIQLVLQQLDRDPVAARQRLQELVGELEASLERVRELAQGVYPSKLLAPSPHPRELAEAVHFAARALGGEPRTREEAGELRFEVAGTFDDAAIEHARARVEAVGGQLTVRPGSVLAAVPLSSADR